MALVLKKLALGHDFSYFFGFPLSVLFHLGFPRSYITWGINNRLVGGHSSET
jgi:hypothetical protein